MKVQGTLSAKSVLLKYLASAIANDFNKVLFPREEPLPDSPVNLNYLSRVIVPLEGRTEITGAFGAEIQCRQAGPGDIIYTARNCWLKSNIHKYRSGKSVSVIIMPNYIRIVAGEVDDFKLIFNPYYHTSRRPSEMLLILSHALNMLRLGISNENNEKACLLLRTFLLETIDELKKDQAKQMGRSEYSFKLIKDYIDHNYHLPINLNQVCQELGYNPSYVSRMFKKHENENIKSYMEKRRMIAAKEMLINIRIKIAQVAQQSGYSSEAYFIKTFKAFYGITPGEFRIHRL